MNLSRNSSFQSFQKQQSSSDEQDSYEFSVRYATFKGLTKRQKKKLLYSETLFSTVWWIKKPQFDQLWNGVFEKMTQARIDQLTLSDLHEQHSIPKSITLPFYSELDQIQIFSAQITSIQRLTFINWSKLSSIYLQTSIDKIKSLNKLHAPRLTQLQLDGNKISEFCLERVQTGRQPIYFEIIHYQDSNQENGRAPIALLDPNFKKTEPQNILWDRCSLAKLQNWNSSLMISNMIRQPKVKRKLYEQKHTQFQEYNQLIDGWEGMIEFQNDQPQNQPEDDFANDQFML